MNGLALTEHRLLVSMFVDAHRPERRYMTRQDFQADYYTDVETRLFNSIVTDLRKQGIVKATPQGGTYAVRLHSDAYKAVLAKVLDALKADTFEVDWQAKRILTDADESDHDSLIPCPNGWMLVARRRVLRRLRRPLTRVPLHQSRQPRATSTSSTVRFMGTVSITRSRSAGTAGGPDGARSSVA